MSRSTTAMLAGGLWTVVVAAVLLFDPGYRPDLVLSCMKLVGHNQGCETAQAQVNEAWFWLHVVPLLMACLVGYLAIASTYFRGRHAGKTHSDHLPRSGQIPG